jgi:hypothetical protein
VCAAFRDYRSRVVAGGSAPPDAVVNAAASAPANVRDAARRLAASRTSGDPDAQMAAMSQLAAMCPAA